MKTYSIREVFLTLQGEGLRAGTKAVFVRFAGCNLWDGLDEHRDRGTGPCARWCDTDFAKGTKHNALQILGRLDELWHAGFERWCVITGGEPGLQLDTRLVDLLRGERWKVAVETNGTVENPAIGYCDHICLSPKRGTAWRTIGQRVATEVKVVLPGAVQCEQGWQPDELVELEGYAKHLYVQPQDPGADRALYDKHLQQCIALVQARPQWRLSLQQHKLIGLP